MVNQPFSLPAERAVLGSMMLSKEALFNCVARLTENDFYIKDHKIIFNAISNVHKRGIEVDVVTVTEQFSMDGNLKELSNPEYIYELIEDVVSPSNSDHYVRIVQDKTVLRYLVNLADNIANNWDKNEMDDIGSYIARAETDILNITRSRNVGEFKSAKEVLDVLKEKLFNSSKNRGEITGVPSGFDNLDRLTHGFQKGDLLILAARPGVGKTALSLNFAVNAAIKTRGSVAIFSLEMPSEQLLQRMLSSMSNVNSSKIRSLNLDEREWTKIDVAVNELSKTKIFVDDTAGAKLADIQGKARKLKAVHDDLNLIIVDYLQLITTSSFSKSENRQNEVSEISRGLKEMARELKVPVIALSQLSRSVEKRENKKPMLSDLRESGSIEQDADIVLFIYREDYYKNQTQVKEGDKAKEENSIVELTIAKHRNGPTGEIELIFLKEYGLFYGDPNAKKRE